MNRYKYKDLKYWVHLDTQEKTIKVFHGFKPGNVLEGPFDTEAEAKKAKAEIVKRGKAKVEDGELTRRRGKGSPKKKK